MSPKNILIDSEGRLKLMDFDLSRQCPSNEILQISSTRIGGTMGYMPERWLRSISMCNSIIAKNEKTKNPSTSTCQSYKPIFTLNANDDYTAIGLMMMRLLKSYGKDFDLREFQSRQSIELQDIKNKVNNCSGNPSSNAGNMDRIFRVIYKFIIAATDEKIPYTKKYEILKGILTNSQENHYLSHSVWTAIEERREEVPERILEFLKRFPHPKQKSLFDKKDNAKDKDEEYVSNAGDPTDDGYRKSSQELKSSTTSPLFIHRKTPEKPTLSKVLMKNNGKGKEKSGKKKNVHKKNLNPNAVPLTLPEERYPQRKFTSKVLIYKQP